jgi:antitoxin component of RelBE/YafQ-DinJ toxin-antitoxin module
VATAIISGRVEESTKEKVGAIIRAAGLTVGDVIKRVWDNIARTGELPQPVEQSDFSGDASWRAFMEFRDGLNGSGEGEDWLADLNDEGIRDVVTAALEEKYV